jgi:hypothetical protein
VHRFLEDIKLFLNYPGQQLMKLLDHLYYHRVGKDIKRFLNRLFQQLCRYFAYIVFRIIGNNYFQFLRHDIISKDLYIIICKYILAYIT